jgi:hypothetical protein
MPSAREARAALVLLSGDAVATASELLGRTRGAAEARRYALLESVPGLIGYYADGTSALAADYYEDAREDAGVTSRFLAEPVVADRTVKIRRAVAWASEPLFDAAEVDASKRLAEVVQFEVARPFRDTVTVNRRRDPESVGWRRVTSGGCAFCRMLADRGAVYRTDTARFAAHPHCNCGAEPVFAANDTGETASVLQYVASKKNRTPAQRAELRDYLAANYGGS